MNIGKRKNRESREVSRQYIGSLNTFPLTDHILYGVLSFPHAKDLAINLTATVYHVSFLWNVRVRDTIYGLIEFLVIFKVS